MARVGKAERIYGDVYSQVHDPPFPKGDGVIFFMSDEIQSLTVGDRTFVPSFLADGKSFCFSDRHEIGLVRALLKRQRTLGETTNADALWTYICNKWPRLSPLVREYIFQAVTQ